MNAIIPHTNNFKPTAFIENIAGGLLAPRGACLHNNILAVSDTGKNRVLLWKHWQSNITTEPDIILGQQTNCDNSRARADDTTLQYPSGIWANEEKLIVADAWNHRVLIWNELPRYNHQPADIVVGQPGFEGNEPNVEGIGKKPGAQSLYWPYGLFSDGKSLWIADTGNRRVLFYENIPTQNFVAASAVIGQEDFESRDYDPDNAVWPYSVKINKDGRLLITDTQYYRVLYWKNWKDALNKKAAIILGQPDLKNNGQNQFRLTPAAHTLNWCYDACFIKNGIAIADTGNSRILLWNDIPAANGTSADALIGQKHFEIIGESSLNMKTTVANEMYWPFAVNATGDTLVVADTGNHRILFSTI
ncbi:MAG: hypothetical protein KF862_19175 [Chitinophagaceae bacterium]|nr:hypothetical protein [Chitinophagaceae bacterium]